MSQEPEHKREESFGLGAGLRVLRRGAMELRSLPSHAPPLRQLAEVRSFWANLHGLPFYLVVGLLCLLAGAMTATEPTAAMLLFGAILLATGMVIASPTGLVSWAVVVALTFRGLGTLGLLPAFAAYADIPIAWAALTAALVRVPRISPLARRLVIGLGALLAVALVSAAFDGSEVVRPFFYFVLLGQPFAIIAALVLDQDAVGPRRTLKLVLIAVIALQVPVALFQFGAFGSGDHVTGTLYGSQAAWHLIGALAVLGLVWWLAATRTPFSPRSLVVIGGLAAVPVVAAAKQVILALPAGLMVRSRAMTFARYAAIAVVIAITAALVLLVPSLGGDQVRAAIRATLQGDNAKLIAIEEIWDGVQADPTRLVIGDGPARTVSPTAFLTTDPLVKEDSPVAALGLEPAALAFDLRDVETGGDPIAGSADSARSSAIGLFGDLGVLGAAAYLVLFLIVFLPCRRSRDALGAAATVGLVLLAVLGFVNDWWEQPGFTVPLGAIAGLALVTRSEESLNGLWSARSAPAAVPANLVGGGATSFQDEPAGDDLK